MRDRDSPWLEDIVDRVTVTFRVFRLVLSLSFGRHRLFKGRRGPFDVGPGEGELDEREEAVINALSGAANTLVDRMHKNLDQSMVLLESSIEKLGGQES